MCSALPHILPTLPTVACQAACAHGAAYLLHEHACLLRPRIHHG